MSRKRGGLKEGPLLDIDGILARHRASLPGNRDDTPPKRPRSYAGWSAADFDPQPTTTNNQSEPVMPGHEPNTTSSRERKALRDAADAAAKRSGRRGG